MNSPLSVLDRFTSNSFDSGQGFKLTYESTMVAPQMTYRIGACGGNHTTPNGILTSPSYPDNYPASSNCIYTISSPPFSVIGIKIVSLDIYNYRRGNTFADFDSYYSDYRTYKLTTCDVNYLEVRDGASEEYPLIDGYCGDITDRFLPIYIQSTKNHAFIR